jgi:hypothetical protein
VTFAEYWLLHEELHVRSVLSSFSGNLCNFRKYSEQ